MERFSNIMKPPTPRPVPPTPGLIEPEDSIGQRLRGKKVIITGTTHGVGPVAQELFCMHGATVCGCGRTPGKADAFAATLREKGYDAYGFDTDLKDYEATKKFIDAAAEKMGGIDVLVNNADMPVMRPFEATTPDAWHESLAGEIDVKYNATHAAWEHLKAAKGASIVNVSSISSIWGQRNSPQSAHCAAEAAIMGFTRQIAGEGADWGIRCNAVLPGIIWTEAMKNLPKQVQEFGISSTVLAQPIDPLDVAYMYLLLASDETRMCTGGEFSVDGGMSCVLVP